LRQQPALRERKLPLRLSTAQFGLLDAALRGSPVPNRNVQRSRRRRTEIRDSTRPIHSKLRRIDSRPVIHTERWQITRTRAGYIASEGATSPPCSISCVSFWKRSPASAAFCADSTFCGAAATE